MFQKGHLEIDGALKRETGLFQFKNVQAFTYFLELAYRIIQFFSKVNFTFVFSLTKMYFFIQSYIFLSQMKHRKVVNERP